MQKHQHGGDIYTTSCRIDFSANLNPLGMPERVAQAACEGVRRSVNYPDVRCSELRRALSEKEQAAMGQIICGNGAAELIFLLAAAEKPQRALLVSPGFAEYGQALEAYGCDICYYDLHEENSFSVGEDYITYLTSDLDIIFLCNPNNPTGMQMPRALLERIIGVCRERGIRMVLDVCFLDFLEHPQESDFNAVLQENPQLFLLKAFTKTYAMAGLRLGYGLCADEALLARMEQLRQPWSVSVPAQMAGVAALQETDYVSEARELVQKERRWLCEKLTELGFTVYDSRANFLFFKGAKGLAEKCRAQGILIRDCANYRGLCGGYYRIAVRTHAENEELIRAIEESCDLAKDRK